MPTLQKNLQTVNGKKGIFCYVLSKKDASNQYRDFKLSDNFPNDDTPVESVEIPEGDWKLKVSYSNNFRHNDSYYLISGFGLVLSLLGGWSLYRRSREKSDLQAGIREKTFLLNERVKELSVIFEVNKILNDRNLQLEEILYKVVRILPSGWQFPEKASAKIVLGSQEFCSENYQESDCSQTAKFKLTDGQQGWVEICYPQNQVSECSKLFLKEEKQLLKNISGKITNHLNRILQTKAIDESEKQFRGAFEMSSVGMAFVSPQGDWLKVNKAVCGMLGYTEKELLGMNFRQLTHPEDLQQNSEFYDQILNGKTDVYNIKKRYLNKNGAVVWANLNVAVIRDENKDPLYSVIHIENITQRIESETKLKESEQQLRDVFEKAAIGKGLVAVDGSWMRVNKSLCDMLGYTNEELLSLNYQQITHPDDLKNDEEHYNKLIKGEIDQYELEKRYIHKNGSIIWIHLNVVPIKNSNDQVVYTIAQIENITQRIESETKFRDLVEKSPVGVFILKDYRYLYVNPTIVQKYGYAEEEWIGAPGEKIIYEEDIPLVFQNIKEREEGKKDTLNYEIRLRKKDGSLAWVEVLTAPTIYNGEPAIIGTIIDRTQEKKAQKELQKSQANLKSIFDATEVSYLLTDNELNVISFNNHFDQLALERTGHHLQIGKKYIDQLGRVSEEVKDRMERMMQKVLDQNISVEYEDQGPDYDNPNSFKYYHFMVSPVINNGKAIGVCMAIIDITRRKNLELENEKIINEREKFFDELEKSEANLKTIFNTTAVSYVLTDKNLNIISTNSHYDALFFERTGKKVIIGSSLESQFGKIPLETVAKMRMAFRKVIDEKVSIEYEQVGTDYENPNSVKHYQFLISPVINGSEVIGLCMAIINITERKNLELENQKMIADLSQRNRDLEQFSYILSHNIRIPISNLLGLLKMLDHELSQDDQEFIMDSFKQSVIALDDVVADVNHTLSLRKNVVDAKTEVNLKMVFNQVCSELREYIIKANAKIDCDFSQVTSFYSISSYIHSIFLNLITNSLQFASPDRSPEIRIWTEKKGDNVIICFEDNGSGIDLERYGKKVFGLYKKFDMERSGKGTGLFLVKAQVTALQGTVATESEPDKGTRFVVSVPG